MSGPSGPDPVLVSSAAHIFVDSLDVPVLSDDDAHHLGRVLRLRDDEVVTVTDGQGRWRSCQFRRSGPSLLVAGDIVTSKSSGSAFGVAVSVPKGDRIDWVVQKLTELGVSRVVLLRSDRSVVSWDTDQTQRHLRRLREIVRAAAMQSRRLELPAIEAMSTVEELLLQPDVAVATFTGAPLHGEHRVNTVAVGPEGGWSPREMALFVSGDHQTVGLGATVLRTDTAAVAAAVVLATRRS